MAFAGITGRVGENATDVGFGVERHRPLKAGRAGKARSLPDNSKLE
ncbi:hypothetical protein ACTXGQ_01140 [Marinobacter sp. 1Y8]